MKSLQQLARPNIWNLKPWNYRGTASARTNMHVLLDANECPYNSPYNRYPNGIMPVLTQQLSKIKGVPETEMCIANGNGELTDLLYKCFCEPKTDNVVSIHPTCGTYRMYADINDVECRQVCLDNSFQMSSEKILDHCDDNTKLIWICSPNNPTGNLMNREETELLLECFDGIVVIDETYIDFTKTRPFRLDIHRFPNLVVLDSLDAAWACASACIGMAFARSEIVYILNKVKSPDSVSMPNQKLALEALSDPFETGKWTSTITLERQRLMEAVAMLPYCEKVYGSDANFFLARMTDAQSIYRYLAERGIAVHNCCEMDLCDNCLRITVGTKNENNELLAALRQY